MVLPAPAASPACWLLISLIIASACQITQAKIELHCCFYWVQLRKNLLVLWNTSQQPQGLTRRQKEVRRSIRVNDEHYCYKKKTERGALSNLDLKE